MSTLRLSSLSQDPPLDCSEEQSRILKAVLGRTTPGQPVTLEGSLIIEPWECELLYGEARSQRSVRGLARTLLRARAAEWAISRLLGSKSLPALQAQAAETLLDETLADIGSTMDIPCCERPLELDAIALRLERLYDSISEKSLRLLRGRGGEPARAWRVDELAEDAFEVAPAMTEEPPAGCALAHEPAVADEAAPELVDPELPEARAEWSRAPVRSQPASSSAPVEARPASSMPGRDASASALPRRRPDAKPALRASRTPRGPARSEEPASRARSGHKLGIVAGALALALAAAVLLLIV